MNLPPHSQIVIQPRCPKCGSANSIAQRSQGMTLEHEGKRCRAQKQYRRCRAAGCRTMFPCIKIGGELPIARKRGRRTPHAASPPAPLPMPKRFGGMTTKRNPGVEVITQ